MALNAPSAIRERASIDRPAARRVLASLGLLAAIALPTLAFGQDITIGFGDDATVTERAVQLVGLITLLSLAPSILVMVTSFTPVHLVEPSKPMMRSTMRNG